MQDAGKKLVSAMLGLQSTRAATQPRPFLKLSKQHLAVQVVTVASQLWQPQISRQSCPC